MKNTIVLVISALLLIGCSTEKSSRFFDLCECDKIDFSQGTQIKDSLGHYSVRFPNSNWFITRNLDENGNGVTGSDTLLGYHQFAAITEIEMDDDWPSIEESQKEIDEQFNVIDKGTILYQNQKCYWHLVQFDEGILPIYSLYVQLYKNNRQYIINMSVEKGANFRKKICQLETFLDHFIVY